MSSLALFIRKNVLEMLKIARCHLQGNPPHMYLIFLETQTRWRNIPKFMVSLSVLATVYTRLFQLFGEANVYL
jgi:hypothetical protein